MSLHDDASDANTVLHRAGCACGAHASQADHDAALPSGDGRIERVVQNAVMRALFPEDGRRRASLRSVGAAIALAAVDHVLPTRFVAEAFAEGGTPEKDLEVGFIPITCATPITMAAPMGFYAKQGWNVDIVKTAGRAVIRDKTLNHEHDAAPMLAPMPVAIPMGLGSTPQPYTMPAVENVNGQAMAPATKHKERRDPKEWRGFKLAVPFDYHALRNHLIDFLVSRSKALRDAVPPGCDRRPPVVRPGDPGAQGLRA